MRTKLTVFLPLIVFCLFFFTYCKKENASTVKNEESLTEAAVLQRAKEWYNKNILPEINSKTNSRTANAIESPDWENSSFFISSDIQVTSTPIYLNRNTGAVKCRVIMSLDGDFTSRVIEVAPTTAYFSDKAFTTRFSDFTGSIKMYSATGTYLLMQLSYANGRGAGGTTTAKRAQLSTIPSISAMEGIELAMVEITAPALSSPFSGMYILGISVSGYAPVSVPVMAYPEIWGGGSGGNAGTHNVTSIKNELTNKCLKDRLNFLINNDCKSKISRVLNKMFGGSADLDIVFRERPASAFEEGVLGHLNIYETQFSDLTAPHEKGVVVIDLNVDALPGAPVELVTTVMIHEALHGMMAVNYIKLTEQHNAMAALYRDGIAQALGELYPGLSATDRNDLAWAGLQESFGWSISLMRSAITAGHPFKSTIQNIVDYQDGKKGTPCQ